MNQFPDKNKREYLYSGGKVIGIAFELGFIIALPIICFGLIGKKLDQKFSTHYFVYVGIVLAISLTTIWIYHRFEDMLETLRKASKDVSGDTGSRSSNPIQNQNIGSADNKRGENKGK